MATPGNDWAIGNLYPPPGGIGGFWVQPEPGGIVYPQQVRANSDLFTTTPFSELTGTYIGSCGHSFNAVMVFREYDYYAQTSVALLCCSLCGCVQSRIAPFSDAVYGNTASLLYAILYPGAGGIPNYVITLTDTSTGLPFTISALGGAIVVSVGGDGAMGTLVLLDLVTSQPFTVAITAGQMTVTAGGVNGFTSFPLIDGATGVNFQLVVTNGQLELIP